MAAIQSGSLGDIESAVAAVHQEAIDFRGLTPVYALALKHFSIRAERLVRRRKRKQ
jgi:hypothetical protein